MRGPRKFCQRGSKLDKVFFLVDEGIEDPNTTSIIGPCFFFRGSQDPLSLPLDPPMSLQKAQ